MTRSIVATSPTSTTSSSSAYSFFPRSHTWLCVLCLCVVLLSHLPVSFAQCDPCTAGGCGAFDLTTLTQEHAVSSTERGYYAMLCADDTHCSGQVCEKAPSWGTTYYSLGNKASAKWTLNSANGDATAGATLTVSGGSEEWDSCSSTTASINVTCGTGDDHFNLDKENSPPSSCKWTFTFNSKLVCTFPKSGGTPGSSTAGHGLSGGSIFLILFFVSAFVYFVGGVLFNKYRRGMSGVEMVPNVGFWRDLPGLVRDGCMFSFNKVRGLCGGARTGSLLSKGTGSTYETI